VRRGRKAARVRTWEGVTPHDVEAVERIIAERKELLERFRGTPLGEQLAMNGVDTGRPTTWKRAYEVPDTGRSPAQSTDTPKPKPKPPGGGSSGGGPATGGD